MSSNLSSEDIENVPLVRMEDVQPVRDRNCEVYEELETCVVDSVDYGECVVENEVPHGGVVEFEEVIRSESSNEEEDVELIVPDVLEHYEVPVEIDLKSNIEKPESWPTLEILPGGIIKHAEKCINSTTEDFRENMYECAKCSQSFKYLFCLVKHVKWHETEQKKMEISKFFRDHDKYTCLHTIKSKVMSKKNKRIAPKKTKSLL